MISRNLIAASGMVMLAACGAPEQEAQPSATEDAEQVASQNNEAPSDADMPEEIPQDMRGRWGLVEADCDPNRADAKGLMTVEAQSLTFYESHATLGDIAEAGNAMIRAQFDFSGEGQNWQADMQLALENDGQRLVRTIFDDPAAAQPLEYARCS